MVSAALTLAMQVFPVSQDASLPNSPHKCQIPNSRSSNQKAVLTAGEDAPQLGSSEEGTVLQG